MSETFDTSKPQEVDRPAGPVAAALLATGIGAFTLGLFTTLSEASTGIHDFLAFTDEVGPRSGSSAPPRSSSRHSPPSRRGTLQPARRG